MRSQIRVFGENKISARGKILPRDKFKLGTDLPYEGISDEIGSFLIERAEPMLEEDIPLLPLSSYREFSLNGVRSNFEKNHHRRRKMLLTLTFAEAYERKGRFMEKLTDVMWAMLEETCWIIPAHYSSSLLDPTTSLPEIYMESQLPGLDLYAASACAHLAMARYLLKDELDAISPVICKRIDHQVYLRGVRTFATTPCWWSGEDGGKVNNWLTNITSHILFATAICVEDMALRERVVDRAMKYLDNFSAFYPADGYCDEGPDYWGAAGGNYFDCLELIDDMSDGAIKVYDHPMVKKIGNYICAFHISENKFAAFADSLPTISQPGKMLMRFGKKCQSPELEAFGRKMAENENLDSTCLGGLLYRNFKDVMTPKIKDRTEQLPAKKTVWFGEGKVAVLRQKDRTGEGLYLANKGGHNRESHNHNDVGCIVVYADGNPIFVDPSHGSYNHQYFDWSYRYRRWFCQAQYHSIPSVDGVEQAPGMQYASSDESFNEETSTVSMELRGAFPASAGIISMRRTCRMADDGLYITDSVVADHEADIDFHFTVYSKPEIVSDGKIAVGFGKYLEYDPEGLTAKIERIENKDLPYDDLDFVKVWGVECLWRIVLRARAAEKTLNAVIR